MRYQTALLAALFVVVASAPAASQSNVRGRSWVERRDDWRWTRRPMTGSYRIRINPKFRQDLVDRAMERAARVRVMAEDRALHLRQRAEQRHESALRRQLEIRERMQDRMHFRFDNRFMFRPRRSRVI